MLTKSDIQSFLLETPAAGQLEQAVGTLIGMTDAALEPANPGTVSQLVVGIVQAITQRVGIIVDRARFAKSFELILAQGIRIDDLANRVSLADSFAYELTAGRRC